MEDFDDTVCHNSVLTSETQQRLHFHLNTSFYAF